ncbi:hypothetical protein PPOP_0586 [Paenibacillus popilliae ATCC 14706]|uniref:Uncharacterized protein n=1 Tax=Paenibacillus popilliae ATCC 14706 TaxID=1212764 RepID=M9LMA2_PAEPP|nr:hypothetical protein PPOP_0586 [Paenibacillus popilliae ATCC 14706]
MELKKSKNDLMRTAPQKFHKEIGQARKQYHHGEIKKPYAYISPVPEKRIGELRIGYRHYT